MSDPTTLQFHIVYMPGSVSYLSDFVWSLLEWSDARLCLVSNACQPDEVDHLRRMCDRDDRLSFRALPTAVPIAHGPALNHLHSTFDGTHFCFMDSDVFATGPFLETIGAEMAAHSGVFSASPIWVKRSEEVLPPDFRYVVGGFNRTDTGVVLGTTYFAIYDNEKLTRVIEETGLGFDEYLWAQLPPKVREQLSQLGLPRSLYDTAKALNLMLGTGGVHLLYVDEPALCHIGGSSFYVEQQRRSPTYKARIYQLLKFPLTRPALGWLKRRRSVRMYRTRYQGAPHAEFEMNVSQRLLHRDPIRRYFVLTMDALREGRPAPPPPHIDDPEIAQRFTSATDQFVTMFERLRPPSDTAKTTRPGPT